MIVLNEVRASFYLDSVALMRIARSVRQMPGVVEAGLMIGTPANRQILQEAGVLDENGAAAGSGDLVIALKAKSAEAAEAAMAEARRQLDQPSRTAEQGKAWQPRTLRAALQQLPDASLALISVPGDFAVAEARKAIRRGLDAMIFSDNVPIEDEVALKQEAAARGRLVMGPDCGTAIIAGVPLAFANAVPQGDIGVIGASGTGIQEVSCLIARAGGGISHAIGTGGRDLKAEVGALTTLAAIDLFETDPATSSVVLIAKPPAPEVAERVLERIARSKKPYVVCFLGSTAKGAAPNARLVRTMKEAADAAVGGGEPRARASTASAIRAPGKLIRGLYSGGTLCAEAQVILMDAGLQVASNIPAPGAAAMKGAGNSHMLVDLGDDEFTRGRPHPMIDPAVRDAPLAEALADPAVGAVLVDIVLGFGGYMDPAGHLASTLAGRKQNGPVLIASVTGTEQDPQGLSQQTATLEAAGVLLAPSNADAAQLAAEIVSG
ncbi:MAG: acyl-CoA synthetase FdrA [Hyphomicrobiaceae bacterium]